MKNIVLVVKLTIKENYVEYVTKELLTLHKLTHQEDKGCIQYDLHTLNEEPNSLMLIETWEDQQSLDEHKLKSHFIEFMKKVDNKLEKMEFNILEKIGE